MSLVEDHFKLHHPPFPQAVDKAALLAHTALKDAVERMRFALECDAIALLTAESGCGKTTALAHLARELDPRRCFRRHHNAPRAGYTQVPPCPAERAAHVLRVETGYRIPTMLSRVPPGTSPP